MSSFIVKGEMINKIVSYLLLENDYDIVEYELGDDADEPIRLAHDMYKLNIEAVNQRYGDKSGFQSIGMKYNLLTGVKRITALKALRCWLYQCTEGNVPETKLYKLMEEISYLMALDIVSDLPEYREASWDV